MNSNCPGPVILKDDGNGAPSKAHPNNKSIVTTHAARDGDFIQQPPASDIEIIRVVGLSRCASSAERNTDCDEFGAERVRNAASNRPEMCDEGRIAGKDAKPLAGADL